MEGPARFAPQPLLHGPHDLQRALQRPLGDAVGALLLAGDVARGVPPPGHLQEVPRRALVEAAGPDGAPVTRAHGGVHVPRHDADLALRLHGLVQALPEARRHDRGEARLAPAEALEEALAVGGGHAGEDPGQVPDEHHRVEAVGLLPGAPEVAPAVLQLRAQHGLLGREARRARAHAALQGRALDASELHK